jgi:ankyrin repeat protein
MRVLLRIFLLLAGVFVAIVILLGYLYRDRRPRIYFAAEAGDTNAIALYLASGSNVNAHVNCYPLAENYRLAPLLDIALEHGQVNTVAFLLKRGADPNRPDSHGKTPLAWVIGYSEADDATRIRMLKLLLDSGADPKAIQPDEYRFTPLHEAALLGKTEMAEILLKRGADVRATDKEGNTPLHWAGRHVDTAKFLLDAGADPQARSKEGSTPIDWARANGNTSTLKILTNALATTTR